LLGCTFYKLARLKIESKVLTFLFVLSVKMILFFSCLVLIILLFWFLIYLCIKQSEKRNNIYKGLVLFDIDGTLSSVNSAETNYSIVQACIDNSFAVGICTAGSVYSMENILSYTNWMPKNLYDFIIKEGNITFNNVGSKILMGKPNKEAYSKLSVQHPGFLKGFALEKTANALGIVNPNCMILCDDDKGYIREFLNYNSNLNVVCSGVSCGGPDSHLNIIDVKNAMTKCSS